MILGIDEVGRGPWAGPLVIGAVVLKNPQDKIWSELNDSKKLTAKKRELQNTIILENAKATGLGWVKATEINKIGLSEALKLATMRAICNAINAKTPNDAADFNIIIKTTNNFPFTKIIIDGTVNFLKNTPLENITTILPKADSKIKEVSAASIIAKVARDNYMIKLAKKYPEYGFENHVGYGTAKHKAALEKYGPCPEHRTSFKPVVALIDVENHSLTPSPQRPNSTKIGHKAETIVYNYLKSKGHTILARNHKTKFYEIDIISATKDHIYFTEVKYRKNVSHGQPLEAITNEKKKQMTFAAESFMKLLSKKLNRKQSDLPSPILAAASVSGNNFHLDEWLVLDS